MQLKPVTKEAKKHMEDVHRVKGKPMKSNNPYYKHQVYIVTERCQKGTCDERYGFTCRSFDSIDRYKNAEEEE